VISGHAVDYVSRFQCVGSACEDTCCSGWNVHVDEATYRKYEALPQGPLRVLMQSSLKKCSPDVASPTAASTGDPQYGQIQMDAAGACPFLNAEKLCQIQARYGEELLSSMCATYPRIVHSVEGAEERALSLSCPEAARLVLDAPGMLSTPGMLPGFLPGMPGTQAMAGSREAVSLVGCFGEIREFVLGMLTNRTYALWQRMFLLDIFSRRLNVLAAASRSGGGGFDDGGLHAGLKRLLEDFGAAVDAGSMRGSMETIAVDVPVQLDFLFRMAVLKLARTHVEPRYLETVNMFTRGIGNGPQATMESLADGFAEAQERYFEPFVSERPQMLENLLINTVVRSAFPFGKVGGKVSAEPDMQREFALLAGQFAFMQGMLVGVAGLHRKALSMDHVVFAVQSIAKHFEHHPAFLSETHALLVSSKLDTVQGLTTLLRNGRRQAQVDLPQVDLPAQPDAVPHYAAGSGTRFAGSAPVDAH
jgi:lysine-N-methylase